MRLEVVEAQDHSACMEQVRRRYGADCVVVHSFRVDDRYRVVVALETEPPQTAAYPSLKSAVKNVISGSRVRWDTLVDEEPLAFDERISESPAIANLHEQELVTQQTTPEISSGLVELAARVKALDAIHQPSVLEPESEDFRAAVFSDVLADAVAQPSTEPASQEQIKIAAGSPPEDGPPAQTSVSASQFPSPVNALVNRIEPTLSVTLDNEDWAGEIPIPRVCTSEGAEGFASLLMECVADSQKSVSLSGQTQLRMAEGRSIF